MKIILSVLLFFSLSFSYAQTSSDSSKTTGYNLILETGIHVGITEYGKEYFDFNILNGYNFNEFISLNFGTGVIYEFQKKATIPLFIDARANFIDARTAPFINVAYGKIFSIEDFKKVTPIFKLGFGINLKRESFIIFNYNWQEEKAIIFSYPFNTSSKIVSASSLGINIGYIF